jgi:D-alanyl-D-alanine carboxypeptidase (penicillin-binding protein 5/6)
MITTLISLYAAGTLLGSNPGPLPGHTMPWSDSSLLETTAIPSKDPLTIAPVIKAKAAIAVDLSNGLILYEKNIHESLPIASITKLMTATIILEDNNLKDVVTVPKNIAKVIGSKIWLAPGEKITVENLLYAVLINSGNDAATALAEYNSDTIDKFAEKMNQKSQELGLTSTLFYNPTGLDEEEPKKETTAETAKQEADLQNNLTQQLTQQSEQSKTGNAEIIPKDNHSTAFDLTILGRYAYGKSFVRRAVSKKEYEISSTDGRLQHKLKTTNDLLNSYLKVLGLKTGTTEQAGECLVAIIENDNGNDILTVVLNSPNRYSETKVLADWVFRAYQWPKK